MQVPVSEDNLPGHDHRVSADLTRSLTLLRSAESQLRLHNTDGALLLLAQAEQQFVSAREGLPLVSGEHRFALQHRAEELRETFEDFRVRMSQL